MLAGPQAAPRQIWKIPSTDRESGVSQPVYKAYTQKGKMVLNCILCLSGLFLLRLPLICFLGKQQVQGALWHKEPPEVLLPGKGSAWSPCLAVGTALCAHRLQHGELALPDISISCCFCVEALCKLLLFCGSRGKHIPLLAPWGKVSVLYLGEGNLQPQQKAEKITFHQKPCLQALYLSSWWDVLSQ